METGREYVLLIAGSFSSLPDDWTMQKLISTFDRSVGELLLVREATPSLGLAIDLTRLRAVLARDALEMTLAEEPMESRVPCRTRPPCRLAVMDVFIPEERRPIVFAGERLTLWTGAKRPYMA
jgi:hypothetical protein